MIPLLATLAFADDDTSHDDDVFGSGSTEPAPATEPTSAPPTDPDFQGDLGDRQFSETTNADIASRLGLADERLTIGGKLYLRVNAYPEEGADFDTTTFDNPNFVDLFADVRPNDRVRGFVSGRFAYDFTVQDGDVDAYGQAVEPGSVTLDQMWLKFDVAKKVYVTFGRQRIKWGAGRFWNPTDFLNAQVLDSLAFYDERTGVGLLKVHVPFEKAGVNVYGVANFEGADAFDQVGGAGRIEWAVGPGELSVSAAARKDQPYRLGGDASFALGPFDVHAEGDVQHGDGLHHYTGTLDWDTFTFPEEQDWSDEWVPQVVAGAELGIKYSDQDALYVGGEYFYNGLGYEDPAIYPYLLFEGDFVPFYLGKQYAGGYVYVPSPGRWNDSSFTLSSLNNLSDQTGVVRLDYAQTVLTFLKLNFYASLNYGDEGGEFHFAYDVPDSITEAYGVPDIPAQPGAFGMGAQVNF